MPRGGRYCARWPRLVESVQEDCAMAHTMLRHRRGPWKLIAAVTLLLVSAGCGSGGVGAPMTPTTAPTGAAVGLPTPEQTDPTPPAPSAAPAVQPNTLPTAEQTG